ncbi:MAG: O-antigen ligase family protein [Roseburia sp.]|nr:O-antigen ligase family protein [Roseburia sp.]
MKKKNAKKKQERMPDLLIPLLVVICILPLMVHLLVYSCGYGTYDWYSGNDLITDFYCNAKSRIFHLTGAFALIILVFFFAFYREKTKNMKVYLPLAGYGLFVVLSTIFSVNIRASWQGNFESFETCLVLVFYVVISLYAYQIMESERDYKIIWYGILAVTGVMIVIGMFQVFHHDLMNFSWVQRLLMSAENYEIYGGEIEDTFTGNNVYLTLYNPNYAGVFLNMMFAVVFVMFWTEVSGKKKIIYGILSGILIVLVWYTYSRMSFFMLFLTVFLGVFLGVRKEKRKALYLLAAGILGLIVLLAVADIVMGGRYLGRIIDRNDRQPLISLTTDQEGISIVYGREEENSKELFPVKYELFLQEGKLYCQFEGKEILAEPYETLGLPMEKESQAYYNEREGEILLSLADTTLSFVKEEDGYVYQNFSGKTFSLQDVEKADFHGLEYLFSARGYIWSRTLPLLKKYLFLGSGPDTYAEAFPQEDVAGKIVYADNPDRVIEKGHNDYLTKWVQTGGLSVVCLIIFYVIILSMGWKVYGRGRQIQNLSGDSAGGECTFCYRIGLGCYVGCIVFMASSLTNDSTLQTGPVFWVFTGILLSSAVNCRNKNEK